jgi:TonB-dependent starch-binding outer membrane protein SusC
MNTFSSIFQPPGKQQYHRLFFGRHLFSLTIIFLLLFKSPTVLFGQQTITGNVVDETSSEPLPGVSVFVKGTTVGTSTDISGNYSITIPSDNNVLVFSFIGYLTEEMLVEGRSKLDVRLVPSLQHLEEIVVVGYGTIRKSDLTGSISSVKGEDIRRMPVLNAAEAIQGKASGAYVSRTSGRPGAGSSIKIRGVGSINRIDPLWVVDGVKGAPIGNLDDIESIEILKDASSAAIYGAEAAGGVILVTTRRGSRDTKINVHSYYSSNQTMDLPRLLDANQYSILLLQTLERDGIDMTGYQEYWDREWDRSTNWADVMFQTGFIHNHTISASGGSENANYYLAGGYADQKGTYYGSGFESFNFKINSDIRVNDWLKVGESLTFSTHVKRPEQAGSGIYTSILRSSPTIPVYDPTNLRGGGYGYLPDSLAYSAQYAGGNPFMEANLVEKFENDKTLFANFYAEIAPVKKLSWRTNVVGRFDWDEDEYFQNPTYHSVFNHRQYNTLEKQLYTNNYFMMNSFATYAGVSGSHSYSFMQGFEASYREALMIKTEGRDIPNPRIRNTQMGDPNFLKSTMNNEYGAKYSYFGRINYALLDKYLFTGNYRLDASDKFGTNYSTGLFPSISVGWRLSQEGFMNNVAFFDDLKIRLGWGILGIDNIPSYLFSSTYNQYGYSGFGSDAYTNLIPGRHINHFSNTDIRWEEIEQWNLGVDFAILGNKLLGSFEYYDKTTSNMLVNINLPLSSGFGNARINNGEISNKGIDMTLNWQQSINRLRLNISGNASRNVNKVMNLRDPVGTNFFIHSNQSRTEEGYPVASFYGYVVDGIIRSQEEVDVLNQDSPDGVYQNSGTGPGDLLYRDFASIDEDGNIVMIPDGKVTAADQTFIGNPWPDWVFGFTVRADWNSFDLGMFWQGVFGIDIYNENKTFTEALFSDYNSSTRILDAWSPENPGGNIPRVSYNDPNRNFQHISSYFIEDGSYLRLKNIQLGYTLPARLANVVAMRNARVYISGINQVTITRYSGVDPEFVSSESNNLSQMVDATRNYPQYKSWVFGLQIDF